MKTFDTFNCFLVEFAVNDESSVNSGRKIPFNNFPWELSIKLQLEE